MNDIDDDCEYVTCGDCGHFVSEELYDCPDDIRRCRRCFNRAAEVFCREYAAKEAKKARAAR